MRTWLFLWMLVSLSWSAEPSVSIDFSDENPAESATTATATITLDSAQTTPILVAVTFAGTAISAIGNNGRDYRCLPQILLTHRETGPNNSVIQVSGTNADDRILVYGMSGGQTGVNATGRIVLAKQPNESDTVTINDGAGSVALAFKATPSTGQDVQIGSNIDASLANLAAVINNLMDSSPVVRSIEIDASQVTVANLIPLKKASTSLTIEPIDDPTGEGDESILIQLSDGPGYALGATTSVTITLKDDEPTVTRSNTEGENELEAAEVSSSGTPNTGFLTYDLSPAAIRPLTLNFALGGSATTSDFTVTSDVGSPVVSANGLTLTVSGVPAGSDQVKLTFTPVDDVLGEPIETVTVALLPGEGFFTTSTAPSTISITDNEPAISISFDKTSISENGNLIATVTASPAPSQPILVRLAFAGNGGDRDATIDTLPTVKLTADNDGSRSTFKATGNHALGTIQFLSTYLVQGSPTSPASLDLVLLRQPLLEESVEINDGISSSSTTVTFGVGDGKIAIGPTSIQTLRNLVNALSGLHVTAGTVGWSNDLPIAKDSMTAVFTLAIRDDLLVNGSRVVNTSIAARNPATYTVGSPSIASASITDNEPTLTVGADQTTRSEGQPFTVTITATPSPTQPVLVHLGFSGTGNIRNTTIDTLPVIRLTADTDGERSGFTAIGTEASGATPFLVTRLSQGTVSTKAQLDLTLLRQPTSGESVTVNDGITPTVSPLVFGTGSEQVAIGSSSDATLTNLVEKLSSLRLTSGAVAWSSDLPISSSQTRFVVAIRDDLVVEPEQTVSVGLLNPTPVTYIVAEPSLVTVSIADNEPTFTLALKKNNAAITGPIDEGDTITAIISAAAAPTKPLVLSMEFTGDASNRNTNVFTLPQAILTADQNGLRSTLTASSTAADLVAWNIDVGSASTKARLDLVLLRQPNDGDVVNIDDGVSATVATWTFVSTNASNQQILIGSTIDASLQNLISSLSDVRLVPSVVPGSTNPNVAWGTSLPFPSGKTTTAFTLYLVDDLITNDPDPRTLTIRIADRVPATYTTGFPFTASVTVNDNEPTLSLSLSSTASVTEGATISATITCAPAPKKPFLARLAFTGVDRDFDIATLPMVTLSGKTFESRPTLSVQSDKGSIAVHRIQSGSASIKEQIALVVLKQPVDGELWTINDGIGAVKVFRFYRSVRGSDETQEHVLIGTTVDASLRNLVNAIPEGLSVTSGVQQWSTDLPIAADTTSRIFDIAILDDVNVEDTETLTVRITTDPAYRLATASDSDSVEILDNEPTVQITAPIDLTAEGFVVEQAWHLVFLPTPTQDLVVGLTLSGSATRAGTGRDIALLSQIDLQQKAIGAAGNVQITVEGDPEHTILVQGFSGGSSIAPATGRIILARSPPGTAVIRLGDKRIAFKNTTGADVVVEPSRSPENTAIELVAEINGKLTTMTATGPGIAPSLPIRAGTATVDLAITAFTDTVDESTGETVTITIAAGTNYRVANAPGDHATVRIYDPLAAYAITSEPANPVIRAGESWSTNIRAEPIGPGPRATAADGRMFTVGDLDVVDWIKFFDPVVDANGVITMRLAAQPTAGTVGHLPIEVQIRTLDASKEVVFQTMVQQLMLVVPPPTPSPAGEGKG